MTSNHGHFVWYELLTTDMGAAEGFYREVVGWDARDASTQQFPYRLLTNAEAPVCGVMALPPEALRSGAMPRWAGYVAVADADAAAERLRALGGRVYVQPTDSNIGRIAIVADPQTATLALVEGLKFAPPRATAATVGRVGWHELLAADGPAAFSFYSSWLGWQKAADDVGAIEGYQLFSAGADTIGGIFTKLPRAPVPFWLYYFNVADLTAALQRVRTLGGRVAQGPVELPDGIWIARCIDPQGAMFALQGKRLGEIEKTAAVEVGWSAEWGGFTSRGRIVSPPLSQSAQRDQAPSASRKPKR
ncbi:MULTISPECIES: VOC family protein [unclassified Bradyrhizobium]|uniref:VOC family protein n=1 Tax=unclassified Bradyrhizobium TaxID=2631580 RepID=UPI002915C5E5|nr:MULTISPECIES: VOC family protein [unclassified Bradyrhizobium]